jgi:hypothetical protein
MVQHNCDLFETRRFIKQLLFHVLLVEFVAKASECTRAIIHFYVYSIVQKRNSQSTFASFLYNLRNYTKKLSEKQNKIKYFELLVTCIYNQMRYDEFNSFICVCKNGNDTHKYKPSFINLFTFL